MISYRLCDDDETGTCLLLRYG